MEFLCWFLRHHFTGEPVVMSENVGCFLRLKKKKKPLNLLIKRFSSNSSMKKKKTNFTLKNMVTSMCERNIPFGKNFFLHFRTPKRILKICPLVFLYIPIWKSYNPVLLDFFRGMKDIPKIKHNY